MRMQYMLVALAGAIGAGATPAVVMRQPHAPTRRPAWRRSAGSGPNGVLTVDHTVRTAHAHFQSAGVEDVVASEDDVVYGTCLVVSHIHGKDAA
jgi:hypothetical protein